MAANQAPLLAPETERSEGPENALPEPRTTGRSISLSHAPNSSGPDPTSTTQDVGMPGLTTPTVVKLIDVSQIEDLILNKKEIEPPGEGHAPDCDGDSERMNGPLFYDTLGGQYADKGLGERRKTATLRLMQSKAYTQLLEDRVTELEKTVQRMQNLPPLPVHDDSNKADEIPITEARIDTLTWAQFRAESKIDREDGGDWTHRPEVDTRASVDAKQRIGTIEILEEEPRSSLVFKDEVELATHDEQIRMIPDLPVVAGPQEQVLSEVEPHRIRIRSKLLLKVLKEITGCKTTTGPYGHRMVFFRPFKLLIAYEERLNEYLVELRRLHSTADDANGSIPEMKPTQDTANSHIDS